MSTYIRGPICGIDNCPSRLWRIIAGRRTCQYGHVMEGDVEFNNDEDDAANMGVITRRLNLTTNAVGSFQSSLNMSQFDNSQDVERKRKLYGEDAQLLFLKSFQFVLKKQCLYLIDNHGFPRAFESTVKKIWLMYLCYLNNKRHGDGTTYEKPSDNTPSSVNSQSSLYGNTQHQQKLGLHMTSSISILYLACIHLGLPFYTSDFLRCICSTTFPYLKSSELIPDRWRTKLPNYYLGILEGGVLPTGSQFYRKVSKTCLEINFSELFNDTINIEGLLFKLITLTTYPPEFYFFTKSLMMLSMGIQELSLHISPVNKYQAKKVQNSTELLIISFFILSIRYVLLYDGIENTKKKYPNEWLKALLESTSSMGEDISKTGIERKITHLFTDKGSNDVFAWTEKDTLGYLEWLQKNFITKELSNKEKNSTIDQKIAYRKLHKIIPIESESYPLEPLRRINLSYIEELQERYLKTLNLINHDVDSFDVLPHERLTLIAKLENKVIIDIGNDFYFTVEDIRASINKIEKTLLDIEI